MAWPKMGRKAWPACLAGAACGLLHAGDLHLQPLSLTLSPAASSATIWLDNTGTQAIEIHAQVFAWRQRDGQDQLTPTHEVALSPPMVQLAPGGRQRLRVLALGPVAPGPERSYRIILDEAGRAQQAAVRYSLPLFVQQAAASAEARLHACLRPLGPDSSVLHIANPGAHHAKLVDLAYRPQGRTARQPLAPGLAGYVLAGSHKHWTLAGPMASFQDGSFEISVNGKTLALPPLSACAS